MKNIEVQEWGKRHWCTFEPKSNYRKWWALLGEGGRPLESERVRHYDKTEALEAARNYALSHKVRVFVAEVCTVVEPKIEVLERDLDEDQGV